MLTTYLRGGHDFSHRCTPNVKDYYAILGVTSSATASEIKKAYRQLAIRYHPDKNPSVDAKSHFQEINEAYDVLGDSRKRASYDARVANPFAGTFAETKTQPAHRDPAYHRRPRRRPQPPGPPASYILMRDSLSYMMWISRVALGFTFLFFLDYLLPYRVVDDYIQQIYLVRTGGSASSYVMQTASGKEVTVDNFDVSDIQRSRDIKLAISPIYGSVMSVSNDDRSYTEWVAYMYTTHIFFPILLLINSWLALANRKRVEFCFTLNVSAFILLIINLALI